MKGIIQTKDIGTSTKYISDFKISNKHDIIKGEYINKPVPRTIIYLDKHETFADLIGTIIHEDIHRCIDVCVSGEDEDFDDNIEHDVLQKMLLMQEDLL